MVIISEKSTYKKKSGDYDHRLVIINKNLAHYQSIAINTPIPAIVSHLKPAFLAILLC